MASVSATVQIIQYYMPENLENTLQRIEYFRYILTFCCGGASVLVFWLTVISWNVKIGER